MKKQLLNRLSLILCILIALTFTNFSKTLAATLPSRMHIDSPQLNQLFDNKNVSVSGWALNASGIKDVKIYVDGAYKGTATYGHSRPDVSKIYPGYSDGNKSGFSYNIDVNSISSGKHRISVYANGKNGTSQYLETYISVTKKVSRMNIDSPKISDITSTTFYISGWSLNPSGIKAVQVYINGKFINNAKHGLLRNDVNTVFPGYPNGNLSGFSGYVNVTNLPPGKHKFTIVSIGNDGSKQAIDKTYNIVKKPAILNIDTPTNNYSSTERDLTVSGWALNASGIKAIQYYINNQLVGTSKTGISRPDVDAALPGYINGKTSGFSYSFNAMKYISSGSQSITLKVLALGNDGTSSTLTKNLVLTKLPDKMCIDTLTNNETISGNKSIDGWALNASGVNSVKVYVDDVLNGNATYGFDRSDVDAVYPGYTDGSKSGFKYSLDTSKLSVGNHTLRVDSIGNDGNITSQTVNFKFYNVISYEYYDYSLDYMAKLQQNVGAVYQNTTTWTWDPASYEMIREYIDAPSIANDSYAKYEFLKLSYSDGASTNDLNNILNNKGILANRGQVFLDAGKLNNVNPIYLISHALLETGNGTSNLATGILVSTVDGKAVTPRIVYNFFGIGAYDSDPDKYGSEYAYKKGWFTPNDAITGGATFISQGYINSSTNQDTLYKMRWNPEDPGTHQYATDVRWAYNQVYNIKKLIDQCVNSTSFFNVPVFK
ncbi:MAG: Ig-like domain-containing protein [Clostridiaceae bacterium]